MKSSSAATAADQASYAIGVDVGGTKIAAGLVSFPDGRLLARRQIATAPERGANAILGEVLRLCEELIEADKAQVQSILGIGVGVCELVDPNGNVVSENCIAWKGIPIQQKLSKFAPAVIEADVRAAALAEAMFGAGKPFRQFLYVTVGTGISCCLVLDGEPFTGAHGATGTMASSPVSVPCEGCGQVHRRSLEEIASGPALVTRYRDRGHAGADSGEAVLAAAAAGDRDAIDVVTSAGEALGSSVGMLIGVLDPEALILGGGLGLSQGLFWESFLVSTRRHIWAEALRDLPIIRAATGPDAGVIGAAAAAWKRICH